MMKRLAVACTLAIGLNPLPGVAGPPGPIGSFSDAAAGYLGCVYQPRSEPYFTVCMWVHAQADGVHVEAMGNEDERIAPGIDPHGIRYNYYEHVVVPSSSLTIDESGSIPVLYMDFVLPRTGHVQMGIVCRALGDFGRARTLTVFPFKFTDSEASGTNTWEWGTIDGRPVREVDDVNNLYFTGTTSAMWSYPVSLERPFPTTGGSEHE